MRNKLGIEVYKLAHEEDILTPNILLFPELVKENIALTLKNCKVENLRPHIKTIKCEELVNMLLEAGVSKFKCATIREASLLAETGGADVLLAYPLIGANIDAFLELIVAFSNTKFSVLVDSLNGAEKLNELAKEQGLTINVFIDLNLGMNRTGVALTEAYEFVMQVAKFSNLLIVGLHGYDGHIQETDLDERYNKVKPVLDKVLLLYKKFEEALHRKLNLVLGGSNTFPIYRELPFVECSPGTFMLWDLGYHRTLKEQPYNCAAVLISRVISKPTATTLCLDLGHKAVAAENSIDKRIHIIGHENWRAVSQSEEHLVVSVPTNESDNAKIGDMHYIVPYHICPTVAKYPCYQVVQGGLVIDKWSILQRY